MKEFDHTGSSVDLRFSLLSLWESQWQSQNWMLHVTLMVYLMLLRSRSDRMAVLLQAARPCVTCGWLFMLGAELTPLKHRLALEEISISPRTFWRALAG